jgi:hypothetical protein
MLHLILPRRIPSRRRLVNTIWDLTQAERRYTPPVLLIAVGFLIVLVLGATLFVRLAKSLEPRQRIILVLVVVLAMIYVASKAIPVGLRGYRSGAEFRQRQGR